MKKIMLIAPIIYEFRAAGLVELVPTCQVSPVNPTPFLSSLTLRLLFPAWCSLSAAVPGIFLL